jgi:hypothetical protein
VILASVIAASVFLFEPGVITPHAVIEIKDAKGGLLLDPGSVRFNQNWIILSHKGGDPLEVSKTMIKLTGNGETQNIMLNPPFGDPVKGDIIIDYADLGYPGKLESEPTINNDPYSFEYHGYEFHNQQLKDGYWSAGEILTLNGQDSINRSELSTIKVQTNDVSKTSNNWRFSSDNLIEITIIDIPSQQIIAKATSVVKHI